MKIKYVSDQAIDISKYSGSIAVTFSKEDRESLIPFFSKIREKGFKIVENEIDERKIAGVKYIQESNAVIKNATLLLVIFSDSLLKNDITKRIVWYQIGLMETIKKDHITLVRFSNDPSYVFNDDISSWPTREKLVSVVKDESTMDDVVDAIENKYGKELLKTAYFDDNKINVYVENRVKFHKLSVSFRIEKDEFEELNDEYYCITDEDLVTSNRNNLLENIVHRTKVLRFGYEIEDIKMSIYKDEMNIAKNNIFPTDFECKKTFEESKEDGCYYLNLDFMFPVHNQMGVTMKFFIEWQNENTFSVLKLLFDMLSEEDKKDKGVYVVEDECKIYFKPTIRQAPEHDKEALPEWGVGDRCEFVYPQ